MATDKRLDQVSQLTDFDYALIVKGDQVAKASKQQFAELVGNLLYGATNASSLATVVAEQFSKNNKWKLNSFGENGFDLNNLGINYSVYVENGVNTPNDISTGHCVSFGYGNVYAIQIYTSNTYAWIRCKSVNTWSEWKKLV